MKKKLTAILLTVGMAVSLLSGCGKGQGISDNSQKKEEADNSEASNQKEKGDGEKKIVTISMYPINANLTSGTVTGHKAELFAEHGFELEVWAYSDEKTNAILASGDLPDIMYVGQEDIETMIEGGMLLNLEEYLYEIPHLYTSENMEFALNYIREYKSAGTGKLYALPLDIGDNVNKVSEVDSTERNALKIRWDVYEQIGTPEINDAWDLIDIMEQMVEACPTDADGNPNYGTALNAGDVTIFEGMGLWYRMQGYMESQLHYLLEADMREGTFSPILTKDSKYYEGLTWLNEIYRRGLLDPDSINYDRPTQMAKVSAGRIMIPTGDLPGWAPVYYPYLIPDTSVYYNYSQRYPNGYIAINANTEHLDACLALLDIWCNPDAIFEILNGPDGDLWYSDGEYAYPTDYYMDFIRENGGEATVASSLTFQSGEDAMLWNTAFCVASGEFTSWLDADGNQRVFRRVQWPEVMEVTTGSETYEQWKTTTGYDTWMDWLEEEDAYILESDNDYINPFLSEPSSSMELNLDAITDIVINESWKMVYAESEAEFETIWQKMVDDCMGLGAEEIIEWRLNDIEQAKVTRDALSK